MELFATHQGDILIEKIEALPKSAKPAELDQHGRGIVAEGETSGHLHALHGRGLQFFHDDTSALFCYGVLPQGGFLNHETAPHALTIDHAPQKDLAAGIYRFIRQTEAPWGEAERVVAD